MAKIEISEEMLQRAADYITLAQKTAMAEKFAVACVGHNGARTANGMLEPLFTERYDVKQQYLMGVLAQIYLGQKFDKQRFDMVENGKNISGVLDCCMSEEAYDDWASSHVYSQLNRYVRDRKSPVSDKAYEILNDHKTFGIMLDKAIKDLIERGNDPVDRLARMLSASMTPENVQALSESMGEINQMLEQLKGENK